MAIRTEHCGAKRGKGFWGRKAEAKQVCKRARRAADRQAAGQSDAEEGAGWWPGCDAWWPGLENGAPSDRRG